MNTTNTTTDLHGAAKRPEAGKSGIPGLGARAGRILDIMIGNRGTFFMAMLALLIVVVTMSVLFTVVQVQSRTRYVIASADARLLVAAEFSREVLGADYHDRLQGEDSLSPEAYQAVVSRNNDLCRRLGLQYLWSVLVLDQDIVFTSATSPDLDDPLSQSASFFEVHRDPAAFAPAMASGMRPVFASFTNEWGAGRMVLVPRKDAQGRLYMFGASVQLAELNDLVSRSVHAAVSIGLGVLCLGALLAWGFSRLLSSGLTSLAQSADRMASGDLDAPLTPTGTRELRTLTLAFDAMRGELRRKIRTLHENEVLERRKNDILTMLNMEAGLQDILDVIARLSEENDPEVLTSIMLFDPRRQCLVHAAAPSLPAEYVALFQSGLEIGPRIGSCGTAAYLRERVVVTDIRDSPNWEPGAMFTEAARRSGLLACWSQPILSPDGQLLGTIANYAREARAPQDRHIALLEWAAQMVSLAILSRQARQALREERDLFSAGPVFTIVWEVDANWPVRQVSSNVTAILGYSPEDLTDPSFRYVSLIHPEDFERISLEVAEHVAGGVDAYEQSYRLRIKSGEYRWFYDFTKLVRDEHGAALSIRGYLFDQTHLKEMETTLRLERQRLAGIIEGTNVGTWEWNVRTGETVFNDRWAAIVGHTLEDISPTTIQTWMDFAHPDDLPASETALGRHFSGELPYYEFESRMRHKAGHWVWVLDRGKVSTWTEDGQPLLMLGTHQDITHRKQAEQKLHEYAEQLEQNNIRLDQALLQAEQASRAKSEFLANMSHEIRTPMNAVIGLSDLLLQTDLNDKQRDYLGKISGSSRMLLGIINDILDFSKIEAGKLELERHDFKLDDLLDQMKTLFAATANAKGLELIFRVSPDVPRALIGDSLRLGQILTNLLGNSLKFTEQGEVVVDVEAVHGSRFNGSTVEENEVHGSRFNGSAVEKTKNGDVAVGAKNLSPDSVAPTATDSHATTDSTVNREPLNPEPFVREPLNPEPRTVKLRFTVRDTGIGMDDRQIARLFQAFGQADTSTTRKYGGTGLGLVISRKLVERMGGELGVRSAPGQGSAFFFKLDLPVAGTGPEKATCPELDSPGTRVLVVDDQPVAREVLREILESCRFTVSEADSGQAGVDMVVQADRAGQPYHVILMDWKMPGELDGLQAIQRLHELREAGVLRGPDIPVCIISAYSRGDLPDQRPPFSAFLGKPVTASTLVDAMIEATGGKLSPRNDAAEYASNGPSRTTIPSFAGSSILLVEDNALNQEVAHEILRKTGTRVTIANNGLEAVELTRTQRFDLILMDLQMPVMDGFAAARAIRNEEEERMKDEGGRMKREVNAADSSDLHPSSFNLHPFHHTPIIALTAAVMEADQKMAREAGMDGHLAKPINSAELYRTLGEWLEARPGGLSGAGLEGEDDRDPVSLPAALVGFDMTKGLRAFDGDAVFFQKTLWGFKEQVEREFSALPDMLARADQMRTEDQETRRMVHTVKGVAGLVRAERLAAAAAAIDQAFKQGQRITGDLRDELAAALEQVRVGLEELPPPRSAAKGDMSRKDIASAMHRLLTVLRSGELVEDDLLDEVAGFVQGELGNGPAETLRNLVEDFAQDEAAELLLEIAGKLKVGLE